MSPQTVPSLKSKWPGGAGALALAGIAATLAAQEAPRFPTEITPPMGLGEIAWPADNPYSPEKAELGWYLYYDTRLSADNTVSCASCHSPAMGFTDGKPVSTGIGGQKGTRSAPTSINHAYSKQQFWDGRAASLEDQAIGPITNPIEMGETNANVVAKLNGIAGYRDLFAAAFGSPAVTIENIGKAIATFERTLISGNSAYDRYQAGDTSAMTASQIRGMNVFQGKANCDACHGGQNLTWNTFHNLGVGMDVSDPDTGRYAVTGAEDDWGKFKTPTLRDITRTAPYMHDGSIETLEEVVEFYDEGGTPNRNLDNRMVKLNFTEEEERDLLEFMKALEGTTLNAAQPARFPQ